MPNLGSDKKSIPRGLVTEIQDEVIDERAAAVHDNPDLITEIRWDQSDVFYETRRRLDAMGYDVTYLSKRRKSITKHIKEYCEREGLKRHEIGIFPADRAVMAFQGELYSVSFENYEGLAEFGPDIICIEKEGIVEKLLPYTTGFGVALLQSQGFVSEYGQMLAQEAKEQGANVAMLTDFDASGIGLSFELKDITRLGIDITTIDELNEQNPGLNLDVLKVEERYNGYNHWKQLNNLVHHIFRPRGSRKSYRIEGTPHELEYIMYLEQTTTLPDNIEISYINYIKNRRIELNSIMNEMGGDGPRMFWNWLKNKIMDTFPTRDYTRAITVPKFVFTPIMSEFQRKLQESLTETLRTVVDAIELELMDTKELLLTRQKLTEIRRTMVDELLEEPKIKRIDSTLKKLMDKL